MLVLLPGKTDFLGTMYSFGAMLSFTIAHASVVALRRKDRDEELIFRARPNLRCRGVDWPLFAIFGGLGTGLAWLVVVVQEARDALGGPRLARGRLRRLRASTAGGSHVPLTETVRAPTRSGPAVALEYRNVLVPIVHRRESEEAVDVACRLATERGAAIAAVTVLEVPLELPLDAALPEEVELRAHDCSTRRARSATPTASTWSGGSSARGAPAARSSTRPTRRNSEIIVMGAPRRDVRRRAGGSSATRSTSCSSTRRAA